MSQENNDKDATLSPVIKGQKIPTSPVTESAVKAFENSLDALRDTKILSSGGLAAYSIYTVGILVVFFLLLQLFTAALSQFLAQLILVVGMLLASGLIAGIVTAILSFRKVALAAQLEAEAFQLKVGLGKQRGLLITQLLDRWGTNDYKGFAEAMKDGKILLALDKNYQNLGLGGELFAMTMSNLITERANEETKANSDKG